MNAYDLLIVGGGINGAAIARDAAGRGVSVLLVEQGDLAQATSSASTKLIHGGLRYLEYREFGLVRKALGERATMLHAAPEISWPLRFVIPQGPAARPWPIVRAGLLLYDLLAHGGTLPRSQALRLDDATLKPGLTRGFAYWDAWVDDARLVVLNARDAADHGAVIRTRACLTAARREGDRWRADIADVANGGIGHVSARAIVNAAGPWVAEVLGGRIGAKAKSGVRLVRGSHIIVPRIGEGEDALLLQQPDKRVVFAIPYERDFTLIGTTDVAVEDPADAHISDEETAYLLAAANLYFAKQLSQADVVGSYSGIRALYDDGASEAKEVTRDYVLELDSGGPPLLSVFGGKITTARALAEEAMDSLASLIGGGKAWTKGAVLPAGWSGTAGGEDFGAGLTAEQVDYFVEREFARTAEDILWRRTKVGLHANADVAGRLSAYLRARHA
jgi:glycerol-3-phosphate dehydrogenase